MRCFSSTLAAFLWSHLSCAGLATLLPAKASKGYSSRVAFLWRGVWVSYNLGTSSGSSPIARATVDAARWFVSRGRLGWLRERSAIL